MIKYIILSSLIILNSYKLFAISLTDYKPYKYEVLFTNPKCSTHYYNYPMKTRSGDQVDNKPENVYCTPKDSRYNKSRGNSPFKKYSQWLDQTSDSHIFMGYLSFSNSDIARKVCEASKRNNKITIVVDSNLLKEKSRNKQMLYLKSCNSNNKFQPRIVYRGGKNGLGYHHNKLLMISNKNSVKISFGSGNISSGLLTHHENWHFIETSPKSFFAKIHSCLVEGVLNYGESRKNYVSYITKCRNKIEVEEEEDIKVFIVPSDGKNATQSIDKEAEDSSELLVAAHRFSNKKIIQTLTKNLKNKRVKLILDDDLYWTKKFNKSIGRNTTYEVSGIKYLQERGLETKYFETYSDRVYNPKNVQLHHNKFIIFKGNSKSVFTGAGNLTNAAFSKNFENFYMIKIRDVYLSFLRQYELMWNDFGTYPEDMPIKYQLPK